MTGAPFARYIGIDYSGAETPISSLNNRRRITAPTALRLGLSFGKSPEFLDEPAVPLRSEGGEAQPEAGGCKTYKGLRAA